MQCIFTVQTINNWNCYQQISGFKLDYVSAIKSQFPPPFHIRAGRGKYPPTYGLISCVPLARAQTLVCAAFVQFEIASDNYRSGKSIISLPEKPNDLHSAPSSSKAPLRQQFFFLVSSPWFRRTHLPLDTLQGHLFETIFLHLCRD